MTLEIFDEPNAGIRLPHPPLSLRVHLIIEAAICAAWELMMNRARTGFDLQTANEDAVTLELHERLYNEVFDKGVVDGFDKEIFASITREPKIRNFNRRHPDKMPDLFVEFIGRPAGGLNSQNGLFIECKPVGRKHLTGSVYCDLGLVRFVHGDYAWAMQSAMMVGYVRDGYSLLSKLSKALASKRKEPISTCFGPASCPRSKTTMFGEQVAISKHQRKFNYVENNLPAGAIVIRHLWLRRT